LKKVAETGSSTSSVASDAATTPSAARRQMLPRASVPARVARTTVAST
jgi:hypothetical protein